MRMRIIRTEENYQNEFLAPEDKVGDQVQACLEYGGHTFCVMADTAEEAIAELRETINSHFRAEAHKANLAINKAIGLYTFD